jgi:hypothetical protein
VDPVDTSWLAKAWKTVNESKLILLLLGFLMTGVVGSFLNRQFQRQSWEREARFTLMKSHLDSMTVTLERVERFVTWVTEPWLGSCLRTPPDQNPACAVEIRDWFHSAPVADSLRVVRAALARDFGEDLADRLITQATPGESALALSDTVGSSALIEETLWNVLMQLMETLIQHSDPRLESSEDWRAAVFKWYERRGAYLEQLELAVAEHRRRFVELDF